MHLLFDLIHLLRFNKFFSLGFEHKKGIKPPLPPCQPLEILYIYISVRNGQKFLSLNYYFIYIETFLYSTYLTLYTHARKKKKN